MARERKAYAYGLRTGGHFTSTPDMEYGSATYRWPRHTIRREPPASVKVEKFSLPLGWYIDGTMRWIAPNDGEALPLYLNKGNCAEIQRAAARLLTLTADGGSEVTVEVFVSEDGSIGTREVAT